MSIRIAPATLVCCLLLAAPAAAQEPPAATPTPTPTPAPPAPPARGTLTVTPLDTHRDGPRHVVVAGRGWRVRGTAKPYVAGQTVTVRIYRNGRQIKKQNEALMRSARGRSGTIRTLVQRGRAGLYTVKVIHDATPELERMRAKAVRVLAVDGAVASGQRGVAVRLLQRGLKRLHYAVPRSGVYDAGTQRAVMAWRMAG